MREVFEKLLDAQIYTIFSIVGIVFFSLGFLSIDNATFFPYPREYPRLDLVLVGSVLLTLSVVFFFIERAYSSKLRPSSGIQGIFEEIEKKDLSDKQLDDFSTRFLKLQSTQKRIVAFIYNDFHEGSLDDVYATLSRLVDVESKSALYYRLRALNADGFLTLESFGERTTIVKADPNIANLLIEKKLLLS